MKTELNVNNFDGRILKDTGTIVVLFEADWCPFCRQFASTFELLRQSNVPSARVDLSDLDNSLWDTFSIEIVPTVLIFKSGRIIQRYDGVSGHGLDAAIIPEIISIFKSR